MAGFSPGRKHTDARVRVVNANSEQKRYSIPISNVHVKLHKRNNARLFSPECAIAATLDKTLNSPPLIASVGGRSSNPNGTDAFLSPVIFTPFTIRGSSGYEKLKGVGRSSVDESEKPNHETHASLLRKVDCNTSN